MKNNLNPLQTSNNPTSEESGTVAPPSVGSVTKVTANETLAPKEELAEIIESIEDISEEVNKDVQKAIKIEANKRKLDAEAEANHEDISEFEIEEDEPKKSNIKIVLGVLVVGLGFGYLALKGNKKDAETREKELQNGKSQEVETNQKTGMIF